MLHSPLLERKTRREPRLSLFSHLPENEESAVDNIISLLFFEHTIQYFYLDLYLTNIRLPQCRGVSSNLFTKARIKRSGPWRITLAYRRRMNGLASNILESKVCSIKVLFNRSKFRFYFGKYIGAILWKKTNREIMCVIVTNRSYFIGRCFMR